jgi:hypothetical protein
LLVDARAGGGFLVGAHIPTVSITELQFYFALQTLIRNKASRCCLEWIVLTLDVSE